MAAGPPWDAHPHLQGEHAHHLVSPLGFSGHLPLERWETEFKVSLGVLSTEQKQMVTSNHMWIAQAKCIECWREDGSSFQDFLCLFLLLLNVTQSLIFFLYLTVRGWIFFCYFSMVILMVHATLSCLWVQWIEPIICLLKQWALHTQKIKNERKEKKGLMDLCLW